jgi:MFS family permease
MPGVAGDTAVNRSSALGSSYRRLFGASTISNLGDGIGTVAYPWLASAVTRNPLLIAVIFVVQRTPWLLFTLPAGVITDRHDRRTLMVTANAGRAALTLFVALAVLWRSGKLPSPDELDQIVDTDVILYLCVVAATLLLGIGEVLYDNTVQTFMPSIVRSENLQRANGRLWAAEQATNQFAGPPLGAVLLAAGFAVPFFVDAATFAASAALIFAIVATPRSTPPAERRPWKQEMREGIGWLWHHDLLRPMALILGLMNGTGYITVSIFVLYVQEVLGASTTGFAAIMMAGAVGAMLGGWSAAAVSGWLGSGPSLWVALAGGAAVELVIGLVSNAPAVAVMAATQGFTVVLWNVVTVSLRQTIIPDHLLGRVNSVYRFFAWGMMPIGALVGGAIVAATDAFTDRELALRVPWFVAAAGEFALLLYAVPRLTTSRMDAARAAAERGAAAATRPR